MKKLFALLVLIVSFAVPVLAQGTDEVPPIDYSSFFLTLPVLAGIVLPIAGWINTALKLTDNTARIISWVTSIGLAYVGYYFHWGVFAELGAITTGIYGLATGVLANGVFGWEWVQGLLIAISAKLPKDK